MTPEERREIAKRLAVEHQHTTPSGKVGLCTCRACDDLRRAAAALCEDADMRQRASNELLRVCEAERDAALAKVADLNAEITQLGSDIEDAYAERAAFSAEVARLREGIEWHRQQVGHLGCDANPALWALLDTEGDADG